MPQRIPSLRAGTTRSAALAVLAVAALALPATATEWKFDSAIRLDAAYTSNAFNLGSTGKDRVDARSAANVANGRVRDMDSNDDTYLTPQLEFVAKTDDAIGRLRIEGTIAYEFWFDNDQKSHPEVDLRFEQGMPGHSALGLSFGYADGVYKKNYLRGTTALGAVTSSGRIYDRGEYDQFDVKLDYQRRIWRRKQGHSLAPWLGAGEGRVWLRYADRNFDDFSNRDLDTVGVGFSVTTTIAKHHQLRLSYEFSAVDAPGGSETVIIDEPTAGVDVNGDADMLDNNIALRTGVDRSNDRHTLGVVWRWEVNDDIRISAGYRYRNYDYDSNGALDFAYRNREDAFNEFSAGARWQFQKTWTAALEGEYDTRDSNRDDALIGDEDTSKRRASVMLSLRKAF